MLIPMTPEDQTVYAHVLNHAAAAHPTGSRFICDPPVMDTDADFVVLANDHTVSWLTHYGFEQTSRVDYRGLEPRNSFTCYRRQNYNLIVTRDRTFYQKFVDATKLARRFNLQKRQDRVDLFRAILYGEVVDRN